ncbi:MAG: class I SAM-dependent methyltransferase [Clostridiales bacterium]|jgi:ubiquinone/menaquinone biosynthesis C-methylase UbiE|nr:class I SAM-dependent methyltransferase [Clostridiales bacterium]
MTRKRLKTDDARVFNIAADGRHMPVKDNSFDYITTLAAFGNIPETGKVVREMYRVLKPNGELLIHGTYVDKDSKSHKLAENLGVDTGMVEEYLLCELEQAGFRGIKSTIAAKAVWAENPYDMLPIAGDMQYFYILQARK